MIQAAQIRDLGTQKKSISKHFRTCRPREKVNRPQTRRRRENTDDSLEKMRLIQANLGKAHEILETILRREQRKANLVVRSFQLIVNSISERHSFVQFEKKNSILALWPARQPVHLLSFLPPFSRPAIVLGLHKFPCIDNWVSGVQAA